MILSQTAVYALRALLHLAAVDVDTPMRVDDIAQELEVPRNYLSKILHTLTKGGILDSTRGPGGGFRLVRAPDDLPLSEIVGHFDRLPGGAECLLGRTECSDVDPCAAHERWKSASSEVMRFFSGTSLADLSRGGHKV